MTEVYEAGPRTWEAMMREFRILRNSRPSGVSVTLLAALLGEMAALDRDAYNRLMSDPGEGVGGR